MNALKMEVKIREAYVANVTGFYSDLRKEGRFCLYPVETEKGVEWVRYELNFFQKQSGIIPAELFHIFNLIYHGIYQGIGRSTNFGKGWPSIQNGNNSERQRGTDRNPS